LAHQHLTIPARTAKFAAFAVARLTVNFAAVSMSEEATRRAPMWNLKQMVDRYNSVVAKFGDETPLASFGLQPQETETLFNVMDEDYHISRFLHFSKREGTSYLISGSEATHVSIDPAIQSIL
jgi:hypothetical protein